MYYKLLRLAVALAICSIIFTDQPVYSSKTFQLTNSGVVVEHFEKILPEPEPVEETRGEETTDSIEYAVEPATSSTEDTNNEVHDCTCANKKDGLVTKADQSSTGSKADKPKARRYKVITITLPEDFGSETEPKVEEKVDIATESAPEAKNLAAETPDCANETTVVEENVEEDAEKLADQEFVSKKDIKKDKSRSKRDIKEKRNRTKKASPRRAKDSRKRRDKPSKTK